MWHTSTSFPLAGFVFHSSNIKTPLYQKANCRKSFNRLRSVWWWHCLACKRKEETDRRREIIRQEVCVVSLTLGLWYERGQKFSSFLFIAFLRDVTCKSAKHKVQIFKYLFKMWSHVYNHKLSLSVWQLVNTQYAQQQVSLCVFHNYRLLLKWSIPTIAHTHVQLSFCFLWNTKKRNVKWRSRCVKRSGSINLQNGKTAP